MIYGCTHYPVLGAHFAAALGDRVALVDPAVMQAERAAALLSAREVPLEGGAIRYVTSGDPRAFAAAVARVTGERRATGGGAYRCATWKSEKKSIVVTVARAAPATTCAIVCAFK